MNTTDKWFVAFIAALVILGVVAFTTELTQPEATYREGVTPEDVVQNYVTALQRDDYQYAYEQLSPQLRSYPEDLQMFVKQVRSNKVAFPLEEDITFAVLSSEVVEEWAIVQVEVSHFYNDGPFSRNRFSRSYELELEEVEGAWKIADGEIFFFYCWTQRVCTY